MCKCGKQITYHPLLFFFFFFDDCHPDSPMISTHFSLCVCVRVRVSVMSVWVVCVLIVFFSRCVCVCGGVLFPQARVRKYMSSSSSARYMALISKLLLQHWRQACRRGEQRSQIFIHYRLGTAVAVGFDFWKRAIYMQYDAVYVVNVSIGDGWCGVVHSTVKV